LQIAMLFSAMGKRTHIYYRFELRSKSNTSIHLKT
jgi:hypothetical protein